MVSILLIFFVVFANGDCQNPMFADPILMPSGATITVSLLPEPQPQSHFGSCIELDGKPSCCNSSTWLPVQQDLKYFDALYAGIIQEAEEMSPEAIVDNICALYNWTLNPAQYQLAVQLAKEFKTLIPPSIQCSGGFLGYFQGMLCFSCYPNWSDYFNPTTLVMALSEATCNGVWGECSWFFASLQEELVIGINIVIQILEADPSTDYSVLIDELNTVLNLLRATSFCQLVAQKDCQPFMCEDLMHGLLIGFPANDSGALFASQDTSETASLLKLVSSFGTTLTGVVTNNYTKTGFNAYQIGCNSELSTYACPIPNSLPQSDDSFNWQLFLAIFFPIVFGLALAIVIFILYKRRKQTEPVALDDNVHYAKLTETDVAFDPPLIPSQTSATHQQPRHYIPPQSTGTLQ